MKVSKNGGNDYTHSGFIQLVVMANLLMRSRLSARLASYSLSRRGNEPSAKKFIEFSLDEIFQIGGNRAFAYPGDSRAK